MFKNIIAVAIAAAFSSAAFAQTPSAAGATKAIEAVKPAAAPAVPAVATPAVATPVATAAVSPAVAAPAATAKPGAMAKEMAKDTMHDAMPKAVAPQTVAKPAAIEKTAGAGAAASTTTPTTAAVVAKSAPDGYTLVLVTTGFTMTPGLQKVPYDPIRDFTPLTLIAVVPNVLVVHPSLPAKSLKELVALSRDQRSLYFAEDLREGDVWLISWPSPSPKERQ